MILPTGPLEDTPNPHKERNSDTETVGEGSFWYLPGGPVGVNPKIGVKNPKMDGENNGSKPYEQMDDLGGF